MLNFLRKLRRKEMKGTKYFKYAIGEIFLVMVGILLALTINNWNEGRKQKEKTEAIISQIIDELKLDIEVLQSVNKGYFMKDSLIEQYKKSDFDKPLKTNLDTTLLENMIRTYLPFEIHNRGFQLLMDHTDEVDDQFAEDIERLLIIYQDAFPHIEKYMEGLFTILDEHKRYMYENFDWYGIGSLYKGIAPEEYRYYMHSPKYKNYVSVYREMYSNIIVNSRWFIDLSIKAIVTLEDKLGIETSMGEFTVDTPIDLVNSMIGTYSFAEEAQDIVLTNRGNQLYNASFEGEKFFGKAFDSQYIAGILRYLGDSTFYHNVESNLRLNSDGSISIEGVFGSEVITSIGKK